ncbi:DnaJ central domain [Aureococcus anophagefferens]|nr:DnaJ central domain [Aureococcus anophagefferens]
MLLRLLLVAGAALTAHADDAYAILGVPRGASTAEIKAAYRKAALRYHPDKGGDPDMFVKVAQAFEDVGDPAARRRYDAGRRPRARAARRRYDALPRARDVPRELRRRALAVLGARRDGHGSLRRDGAADATINPDGSVDERTTAARQGRSTYSKVTRTGPDGRSSSSVSISLGGPRRRARRRPYWLARLPARARSSSSPRPGRRASSA